MRLNRFGIRARITGGSLLIAILISVVAGRHHPQPGRPHRLRRGGLGAAQHRRAVQARAQRTIRPQNLDPPGGDQEAAVVNPDGVAVVDTLQRRCASKLKVLISQPTPTPDTVVADGVTYLVSVTRS